MGGRPYVLVDRDGTLLQDSGFMHRIAEYAPLPGAIEGLRLLQETGFGIALVTNQSGIGRGYFSEEDFQRFQTHFIEDFAAHGVRIEATYFCPHRPDAGCACRKPATGLLERAERELDIDLQRSWVVGDSPEDMELARRAGCRGVYVLTGSGASRREALETDVPVVNGFLDAARHIIDASARCSSAREPR
jgi:D-glycero-D-manno-heptose 1,7-bisphosphate phosphatase